ncbi:Methane oxygenase PmoA [Glycomyces sambucus]|uniref:Methane oxygenase PmoA n=1 Tax=Glycomyces sambucus TaxID=380244 RepID=A0A1G9NB06_9ACTN|nr:PmoA family protein [Glycomyces sambucus]SDL83642.1 Methane oxygenase PmoA [Glycomyces sambucus]
MEHSGTATVAERPEALLLQVDGREVASYVWRSRLPASTAPRPFLHPVRTLAGTLVTDARPHSHTHQLGISIAAPDIGGRNFWGGRTFVPGHGPAWLDDHGAQRHRRWLRHTDSALAHTLNWVDRDGAALLNERRSIACGPLTGDAWTLSVRTRLANATEGPLQIRSPAALGRVGAGYGGFFWRGPSRSERVRVLSPAGAGERAVNGTTAEWVAVSGGAEGREWTVVFTAADETTAADRWFVRSRDYLGVGSSLTWDRPLVLEPGGAVARHILTVVADGTLSDDAAAALAAAARSAP